MSELIHTNENGCQLVTQVRPLNGKYYMLSELHELVKCNTIEIVDLPNNRGMAVDGDGLINGSKQNTMASKLSNRTIRGNALVCDNSEIP